MLDIPDGLIQFRMNLEELLVDICQLLGSDSFVQKVISTYKEAFNIDSLDF